MEGSATTQILGIPVEVHSLEPLFGQGFFIQDCVIGKHGFGDSVEEATNDYKRNLTEYFERLVADEDKLGEPQNMHLAYLRKARKVNEL